MRGKIREAYEKQESYLNSIISPNVCMGRIPNYKQQ